MTFDIPELDPALCADRLIPPVTKWGTRRRDAPMPGTYHCYGWDYTFTGLMKRADVLVRTGCRVAVEPNFSTHDDMPMYEILWWTGWKRRIARFWQDQGLRIVVDLNVGAKAWDANLIGVPRGWTAYAVRAHKGVPFEVLHDSFTAAAGHAGHEDLLFCVFGGGRRRVGRHSRANGWHWVPEHRQVVAGRERPYGGGD